MSISLIIIALADLSLALQDHGLTLDEANTLIDLAWGD